MCPILRKSRAKTDFFLKWRHLSDESETLVTQGQGCVCGHDVIPLGQSDIADKTNCFSGPLPEQQKADKWLFGYANTDLLPKMMSGALNVFYN